MVAARYLQDLEPVVCYYDAPAKKQGDRFTACGPAPLQRKTLSGLLRGGSERSRQAFFRRGCDCRRTARTGARSDLSGPLAGLVERANRSRAKIIAADIPTPGIRADLVLSFHRPKVEGARVADIGIPLEAECMTGPGELTLVPKRDGTAHKGAGGKVLVIGGGPYQGAPFLAGLGALRAGADIVRVASPAFEPIPEIIHENLPGKVIVRDHVERLLRLADLSDVVVIGNGLGDQSHNVIREVASGCKKAVFDADALRLPLPYAGESLYTPHAGEFTRITGVIPEEDLTIQRACGEGRCCVEGDNPSERAG